MKTFSSLNCEAIRRTIEREFDAMNASRSIREWFAEVIDLETDDGLYKNGYCWGWLHGDSTPNKHWINERAWMLGFVDGKGDRESSVLR